jgi:hypothetical protein
MAATTSKRIANDAVFEYRDAVFEYRYVFPGFPTKVEGRDALMALCSG